MEDNETNCIPKEQAEAEFVKFCEAFELDPDSSDEDTGPLRPVVVKALMSGKLTLDEESRLVLHTPGRKFVFNEPTGADMMAMDGVKGQVTKGNRLIAAITKASVAEISKMKGRHLKVAQAIAGLFMG